MNYTSIYQPRVEPTPRSFTRSGAEIAIGALLLLSPMFWLFIAELIK